LWGQIIKPLSFKSLGKNKMLGIRFYPHTAAIFMNDHIHHFNDQVTDFESVAGTEGRQLYEQLLNTTALNGQLALLESFLWKKVKAFQKKITRFQVIDRVIAEMNHQDFFDNIQDVAARYGISSRYLQKLFLEFTGITPKLFHKINRFQKGLVLTGNKQQSLTSIAYLSGYFDQSHFVRDFKLFTGIPPSNFDAGSSSAILASPNKS
jgi:AraC-like DNA-binding protein